jgi:hypothetical protein
MDEAGWLACENPGPMLVWLRSRASARKVRLFACACCRRVGHLLSDPRSQEALATAERYADGLVGDAERSAARRVAQEAAQSRAVTNQPPTFPKWERRVASAVYYATAADAWEGAYKARQLAAEALFWRAGGFDSPDWQGVEPAERRAQAELLRDIFGWLPFRLVPISPAWLAWDGGTVAKLAAAAYEERSFDRLAVLADALEEAGCADSELLGHLRGPGPHARGCWALDLLLGKG